jgi:uncharacterized protein (DUF1684 family)
MLLAVIDPAAHESMVKAWRSAREGRLRSESGWLTQVDRLVLSEGDNEVPFGVVTLERGVARLRVSPGLDVRLGAERVAARILVSDEAGAPDRLDFQGRRYELFRRGDAFAIRVRDPRAPALLAFTGLQYFPIDPAWRIAARFERYTPMRTTQHQFDIGSGWTRPVPGAAHFTLEGRPFKFEPVLEEDSGRLFFVFSDLTSKSAESYPAGRFLYADLPPGDEVILDFNLAFNPPCAFTPFATCPVTPPAHRLPVRVPAGEKTWELPEPAIE